MNDYIAETLASLVPPPQGVTFISQSIINQMQLCPAIVGYSQTEGFLKPVGVSLSLGQSVHHCAELHMAGMPAVEVMATFDEWFEASLIEYDWTPAQVTPSYEHFKNEVMDAYRLWIFQVYPSMAHMTKLYAETRLYKDLGDDIWLAGTPDQAFVQLMVDYKTAKDDRKWNQIKADLALQTSIYLALHNHNFPKYPLYDFKFYVYDRAHAVWQEFRTKRNPKELYAAELTALQYGKQVRARAFPATPVVSEFFKRKRGWYCSAKWCDAWNVCEHKFMNDAVDETVVSERVWSK